MDAIAELCVKTADMMEGTGVLAQSSCMLKLDAEGNSLAIASPEFLTSTRECYCIVGGLGKVVAGDPEAIIADNDDARNTIEEAVARIIKVNGLEDWADGVYEANTYSTGTIFKWNDARGRTLGEIVNALRKVGEQG